jgi:hypothetical protein
MASGIHRFSDGSLSSGGTSASRRWDPITDRKLSATKLPRLNPNNQVFWLEADSGREEAYEAAEATTLFAFQSFRYQARLTAVQMDSVSAI